MLLLTSLPIPPKSMANQHAIERTKLEDDISLTHRSTNKGKCCNRNLNIILVSFDAGVKPAPEFIGKGGAASENIVAKNTDDQLIAIGFGSIKC